LSWRLLKLLRVYCLLALIVVFAAMLIYNTFFLPYKLMLKEGVDNFPELFELAQKSEPREEPYLTSEVMPDHPLYSALLAKQRNQPSDPLWEPLLDKNNADAMYWYAMNNMAGVHQSAKAGLWFVQSAELGNPYAAYFLRENNYICNRYMAHLCDDKWKNRAQEIFEELADKGDLKATYYLHRKFGSWKSSKDTKQLVSTINESAKQGYYRPIVDFIGDYERDFDWKSLEDKKKGFEILMLAANDNYVPAINKALDMLNDKALKESLSSKQVYEELLNKAVVLGAHAGVFEKFYINKERFDVNSADENAKLIMNTYDCIGAEIFNSDLFCNELSVGERKVAMKEARIIISKMHSPIFIDELHPDTF
ncbi:MAG: hypothetical protein ACPGUE_20295, partial [Marinomonas sp.]